MAINNYKHNLEEPLVVKDLQITGSLSGSGANLTGIITSTTVGTATTISFNPINTNITISTLDPSGGNNGDIWIKYIP